MSTVNCGVKTATCVASTVGTATNRRYLRLTNESDDTRVRVGDSGISASAGVIVEPGATVEFRPLPSENTEIYAMSEGKAIKLAFYEVIS